MEPIRALVDEIAELVALLGTFDESDFRRPTRCIGWDVADVVLHLAQTNEMAAASARQRLDEYYLALPPFEPPATTVDDNAARLVEIERGREPKALVERYEQSTRTMIAELDAGSASDRLQWVAGTLSRKTLASTRLAETWIHHGDIAEAVGRTLAPSARLHGIARLAWRTIPYAFAQADATLAGPVALRLIGPAGEAWDFEPDGPPTTVISGSAADLCAVAARRVTPADTTLRGTGPDADAVLARIRTYAL